LAEIPVMDSPVVWRGLITNRENNQLFQLFPSSGNHPFPFIPKSSRNQNA